mgnify:CR=1 FL=1
MRHLALPALIGTLVGLLAAGVVGQVSRAVPEAPVEVKGPAWLGAVHLVPSARPSPRARCDGPLCLWVDDAAGAHPLRPDEALGPGDRVQLVLDDPTVSPWFPAWVTLPN